MKKIARNFLMIVLSYTLIVGNVISVDAAEEGSKNASVTSITYKIEPPEDAVLLNTNTNYENGCKITTSIYQLSDGSVIADTISESNRNARSSNGSDTVTRTKTQAGWGTLTVTANFDWYTQIPFSYVRCSSMSSSFAVDNSKGIVDYQISESYNSDYVSIGKARASALVSLVRHYYPEPEINDFTLTIICSDEGTISDN